MFPKVPLQGGLVALRGFVFLAWVPPGQLGRRVKWQLAPHDLGNKEGKNSLTVASILNRTFCHHVQIQK